MGGVRNVTNHFTYTTDLGFERNRIFSINDLKLVNNETV